MLKISCFVAHLADVVLHYMWVLFSSWLRSSQRLGNRQRKVKSCFEETFQVSVISTMIFFIWKVNSLKTYEL